MVDAVADRPRGPSGVLVVGVLVASFGGGFIRGGWTGGCVGWRPVGVDGGLACLASMSAVSATDWAWVQLGGVALQRATSGGVAAAGLIQLAGEDRDR